MDNGFLKRIRDVEHAAEYFSDTGPMMVLLSDDTTFTNRLKPTNQFFKNVWTGTTTNGNRLFKSAWLSSTAFDTEPPRNRDLPFSCLAVKPMRYLAWKTGDTATIKLLHEWAKTWRNLALRTDKGKPKGIIPPSVRYPDEAINGDEKTWYQTNMFWHYFEWDYGTYWKMYDQLLFTAQITGDNTLLEPLFETLNLVKKHSPQLSKSLKLLESSAIGTEQWAVNNLIKETGFWTVVSAWRFWSNDTRFDDLLLRYGSPYTRFRLSGDETDLAHGYDKMLQHLRYNFPMVTSEALFTDRVYLTDDDEYDPADYARALLTGDEIQISASPYPSITWTDCPDDLTVLVSESTPKSLKIKLFLYGNQAKKAGLRLWQLEKGTYTMYINSGIKTFEIKERGQPITFEVKPYNIQILSIEKIHKTDPISIGLLNSKAINTTDTLIILLENDTFKLTTTYRKLVSSLVTHINKHDVDWDKDLLALFMAEKSKIINAQTLAKTKMNKSRLEFCIADLLEKGDCILDNKLSKKEVKNIIKQRFESKFWVGREFIMNDNILILKIIDGVF